MALRVGIDSEDRTTTMVLEQTAYALSNVRPIIRDFMESLGAGPPHEKKMQHYQQFREASVSCLEQLDIAICVARLGYQSMHRLERLLCLLDTFLHTSSLMLQVPVNGWTFGSTGELWLARKAQTVTAVQMVQLARNAICSLRCAGWQSSESMSSTHATEFSAAVQAPNPVTRKEPRTIDAQRYLRPGAKYSWQRDVELMAFWRTEDEEAEIVVESLGQRYKPSGTCKGALWNNLPLNDPEYTEEKLSFDNVNAAWLSPGADALFDKTNADVYRDLFHEIESARHTPRRGGSAYLTPRDEPICLARALFRIQIDLALIFDDDLSVLVWPLGKANAAHGRYVVVQCGNCGYYPCSWRYRMVVAVLDSIQPDGQIRPTTGSLTTPSTGRSNDDSEAERAGNLLEQDGPTKKVTFLDLPAELRNIVYEEYLTFSYRGKHRGDRKRYAWTRERNQDLAWMSLPEISQTCRQLRDEVTPLWLASKPFRVDTRRRPSPYLLTDATPVMTPHNRVLSTLASPAHLTEIQFLLRGCQRHVCGDVTIQLCDEAPGFRLGYSHDFQGRHGVPIAQSVKWRQLRELVRIVVQDRVTDGLSVTDVAAIADFLGNLCPQDG